MDLQEMSMMHEAVDYNALSWVRQEIDSTLRRAHAVLVEYSDDIASVEHLSEFAELLHLLRGPLQIAELAGADLLVAEMENVVEKLQSDDRLRQENTLEALLQSMRSLPAYISRMQSSPGDSPELLRPQLDLLRSITGAHDKSAADSMTTVHAALPDGVFLGRESGNREGIAARARAARVQFQSALLAWYRGEGGTKAIDGLTGVLVRLQEDSVSEPEARLWWVAAGVAEALGSGLLSESREIKQLFGKVDRQIKRLVVDPAVDFGDVQTQALLDGLLDCISGIQADYGRVAEILAAYGQNGPGSGRQSTDFPDSQEVTAENLLNLDSVQAGVEKTRADTPGAGINSDADAGRSWPEDNIDAQAVSGDNIRIREILKGISLTKEAIEDYLKASGGNDSLQTLPVVLEGVCGDLWHAGLDREAGVIASVAAFINSEMLESSEIPDDRRLNRLADAICSVEFYLECVRDGRIFGSRIIESAEADVAALGWPVSRSSPVSELAEAVLEEVPAPDLQDAPGGSSPDVPRVSSLQVIDKDADKEILEIFFDESAKELQTLDELLPGPDPEDMSGEMLEEVSRIYHTLKGNSRMLGANSLGEFACIMENLVNAALKGSVRVDPAFVGLLARSREAVSGLVAQIKEPASEPGLDIDALAAEAVHMNRGIDTAVTMLAGQEAAEEDFPAGDSGSVSRDAGVVLPVLADDADPEIVEIFIDEASEEITRLSENIPRWIASPGKTEPLSEIRRSMHTLKGSGRMTGALSMGEFAWSVEDLLNRVIDGSVIADESLYALVTGLPPVLQQLVEQIRDGTEPVANISALMTEATRLRNRTGDPRISGVSVPPGKGESGDAAGIETQAPEQGGAAAQFKADPDSSLAQIYERECQEILDVIQQYLDNDYACGYVTEPLYRGLHTLAGISESAGVGLVGALASDLDKYFSNLYQMQHEMPPHALDVLRDCSEAIADQIGRMPDVSCDPELIESFSNRIADLQRASEQPVVKELAGSHADTPRAGPVETDPVRNAAEGEASRGDEFANTDQELFEVFLEEATDIMEASERVLHAWAASPDDSESLVEYQRHLHTLKGSARMMNIAAIGDLSHSLETLLTRIVDNTVSPSDGLFSALFVAQDQLTEMLEQVRHRHMPDACDELQVSLEQFLDASSPVAGEGPDPGASKDAGVVADIENCDSGAAAEKDAEILPTVSTDVEEPDTVLVEAFSTAISTTGSHVPDKSMQEPLEQQQPHTMQERRLDGAGPAPEHPDTMEFSIPLRTSGESLPARRQKPVQKRGEPVKVQPELLDDLVNYAGEINIYRSRMETQIGDYRFNLGELEQTINRLRDQLRKLEIETEAQVLYRHAQESDSDNQDFDPLELDRYSILQESSRSLMESISDLYSLLALMENTTRDSETLLLQQSRVSTDLHEGLMHTRMTPFSGLETRLKRIVRQSARQLDKKVELELQGADGEMDRAVIERIIAPLEHMLRNSVAHGIEKPADRVSKGKNESGKITIAFGREGPDIVLQISDDGAGMNVNAIREKAVEKGLLAPDADMSESDVTQFVMQTGFSTASEVTQISGRGVGLDVVNSEVKQLGGSLHIESAQGAGTIFTIRLPYTLAINHALLVKAGSDTYCVPLGNVEGVVRIHPEELLAAYAAEEQAYEYAGNQYQLKHLATLLNTELLDADHMSARIPVLLMRVAEKRIALHVESLLGSREIVIKPVGVQLNAIDGISGATILGDGSVAMILDVFALSRSNTRANMPVMRMVSRDEKRLVVMVVDDSITVRKVTSRLLERNGYKVLTAKDGVDATGQLQGCTPDIVLLDIEMPRMDGFELATHMRNDDRLRHIPLVMITSRTGDKHRERARQIGVSHYLGKPYQENDLLGTIDQIIRVSPASSVVNHVEA